MFGRRETEGLSLLKGGSRLRGWLDARARSERLGIYVGGAVLLFGLVAAAFLASPLLSALITPRIASAIEARLGEGYRVHIGATGVDLTRNGLDLKLDGFEIRDPADARVLAVPTASFALDGNLVLSREVSLRRLKLSEPKLTLRIEPSGQVSLAGAEGGSPLFSLPAADVPQAAPAEIFGFLSAADAVLKPGGPFANFELAEVLRADITVDDKRRERVERFEQVDVRVVRRQADDGLTVSASSASPRERWSVSATLAGKPGSERNFDLGFENLSLGRLVYELLRGTSPAEIGGQLFGHVYARLAPDGSVPAAEARVDMVGFSATERDKPEGRMEIERTRLQLAWNGGERKLRMNPVEIFAQSSRFTLGGFAHSADETFGQWSFSLAGNEQPMPGADPKAHAFRFERIEAAGQLDRTARRVVFDKATIQGRAFSVAGYGSFDFSGPQPIADLALAGSRSPVAAALRVWPGLIAPNTRKWVAESVPSGTIQDVTIAMRGPLGAGLDREVALDVRFSDAVIEYLKEAPPAVGVQGNVRVMNERMETVIDSGRVDIHAAEPLSIAGTRFSTDDHRPDPFQGALAVKIEGPVASAGALMTVPRLAAMAPGAAPLMQGSGKIATLLTLTGPYGKGAEMSALVPTLTASLSGWSMDNAVGERDIDNGNFTLNMEPASANLRGEVRLSGAPLSVEAFLSRTSDNKFGQTVVRFSIDPSKMKDFDAEALRIDGPISAELVQEAPGVLTNSRLRADLSGAALQGPVGLAKARGAAGQVSFNILAAGENWRLSDFAAQGSGIDIRGTVDIAKSGGLAGAQFAKFAGSDGDDVKLDVSKAGNAYKVVVQGARFNAQPLLKDVTSGAPEKRALDLDVEAKIGLVTGQNGEKLTGADIRISRRNNTTRSLYLTGNLGAGPIEGRSSGEEPRLISVRAADAGATLRFADVYRRVRGGQMEVDVAPGETSTGKVIIRNFQVVGDEKLASVASGRNEQKRANSDIMTFTKMESKFRLGGGRILVDDFEVYGNELGATLSGEINYTRDQVAISGTFVPAYALNNLFGRLPLLGPLLGGSEGGLVGITFALDGKWTAPQMRVNPFSAVAPGFLRKLFEFRNQTTPASSTTGNARPPQKQRPLPQ